jgi:paraquat-inducible protein A
MAYLTNTVAKHSRLLACPECDLLQREPRVLQRTSLPLALDCPRCGATLSHHLPRALELSTAFSIAAAVALAIGASFSIMTLELQGRVNTVTLLDLATGVQAFGMSSVAALIVVTAILLPVLEVTALLYMLVPLVVLRRVPRQIRSAARLFEAVRPWAMLEVLMLATIVSIGRLEKLGPLSLGPGFWSLVVLMVLFALIDSVFEPGAVWDRAEELGA